MRDAFSAGTTADYSAALAAADRALLLAGACGSYGFGTRKVPLIIALPLTA